jgi:copper chaperone
MTLPEIPVSMRNIAMQFELTSSHLDAGVLAAALRPLDPDVRVALDAARGRLEVIGTATAAQVLDVLEKIGCAARPLEKDVHISGGSTCCGHCG